MIVKKIRKSITLACCLCLMAAQPAPMTVQAKVPEQTQPLMTFILSYSADLAISADGTANVSAYVIAKDSAANTYVKATLQKKSGNSWVNVTSWKKSGNGGYTGITETYPVLKGTYRVKATVKADSETRNVTSAARTY